MKNSTISACSLALFILCATAASSFAQNAAAFIVIDGTTGHVLESQGAEKKLQVGSLTKVAMAMVTLDWLEVSKGDAAQTVTIPESVLKLRTENPIGFQPGDSATLRDLLYAALLQSDNIAAQAIAEHIGQSLRSANGTALEKFAAQMNALARTLHMDRTLFLNPHGLEAGERKLPYSTAADMARLARYAMAKSGFRFYVSQKEREIIVKRFTGEQTRYLLRSTNELLGINAIDGVKTGTTSRAGECVIISAARPPESTQQGNSYIVTPRRVIVVVLGSTDRFNVASQLLNLGWQLYEQWAEAGRPGSESRSF